MVLVLTKRATFHLDARRKDRVFAFAGSAFLAVLILPQALLAEGPGTSPSELERQLNTNFAWKVFTLRRPVRGDVLQYDAEGKLEKGGEPASWTVAGRFRRDRMIDCDNTT